MSLSSWIASVGQNPNFVAFMAHAGFSFMLLSFFPVLWVLIALVLGAAVKEFWFDPKFEINQTIKDGWLDFAGYMSGVALFFINAFWF